MWCASVQRMKQQLLIMLAFWQLLLLVTVCLHSGMSASADACFAADRAALRELAFDFLHNARPNWVSANPNATTAFMGWEGDACCSWRGVVCNGSAEALAPPAGVLANHSSRVSKLLLSDRNLVGPIPPAVCAISALSTLHLAGNFLVGSIPPCLGQNLINLRQLDLSRNMLTGTIPTSFSGFLQLRSLNLGGNGGNGQPALYWNGGLRGSLLPISALPRLHFLDVSENLFDSIPPLKLPRLQWLLLNGSFLTLNNEYRDDFRIPVFTNGTPNLQYLDLGRNFFRGGLSNLSSFPLPYLQHLDLSKSVMLTGEMPVTAFISNFPRLRTLLLSYTWLPTKASQIFELICGLKSLENFTAASVAGGSDGSKPKGQMSGEMPHQLPSSCCESPPLNLTILDLSNNQFQGPFPPWLSLFPNLQQLDLSGNDVYSSAIPSEWQNLTKLSHLRLRGPSSPSTLHPGPPSNFFFPQHMQIWLSRLPLQVLSLSSIGLTNQHLACPHMSLLNTTLQVLDLSANLVTGSNILSCLAHNNFTALLSLDLSHNALAFNLGLTIPVSLTRDLSLSSCQLEGKLSDHFFEMLRHIEGSVSLAHNYFSGNLPSGMGTLSSAGSLDLSYNNFTGPIPPCFGNISTQKHLRYLILENNQLEGEVPEELGVITYLYLRNNQLTKFRITSLNVLEVLDLSYNRLEGNLVQTFFSGNLVPYFNNNGGNQVAGFLQFLIVLLLDHNRLTGELPVGTNSSMPVFMYLSVIGLSGNLLTGTIPDSLFAVFPTLTGAWNVLGSSFNATAFSLIVKNLHLTFQSAQPFGFLPYLYLDLSQNRLHGSIPESLGSLKKLVFLNLSRNQLTGNIPSSLANITSLASLDLSYNRLEGPIPSNLSQLSGLETFNVSFNKELAGPIPMNSPQLEDNTSYIGDPKLCGEPYLRSCSSKHAAPDGLQKEEHKREASGWLARWVDKWIAVPVLCVGTVLGFAGVLCLLRWIRFI